MAGIGAKWLKFLELANEHFIES